MAGRSGDNTDPTDSGYYKAKYQSLEDLPSVGPATASKLREIGLKTVESIAMATTAELTAAGLGEETAASARWAYSMRDSYGLCFPGNC